MKKTIKRAIEVTTRSRKCDRLKAEFYSHDKNNATIELTLDEVTAEQVIALFYFTASKRYYQTTAAIEENKIKIEFDTSLITQDESVICFIYFEKVEQSADVYRFAFDVKMSEIDKTREIPIEEKVSRRVVDISDIVTKKEMDALFERLNITGGYDDRPLIERLERLEGKPSETYDDSALQNRVRILEAREDKDTIYDDSALKQRVEVLEAKSDKDTVYDDSEVKTRLSVLEEKTDKDTIYDDSEIKSRLDALEEKEDSDKQRLTLEGNVLSITNGNSVELVGVDQHLRSDLNNLHLNIIPSEINRAMRYAKELVEKKTDKDTIYDDSAIKQRLATLESKPTIDTSTLATAQSVELVNRTIGEMQGTINQLKVRAEYEIHGTGMPNGKVAAPIGTTYVDEAVTNGALKWIKRTNGGNQGWEVLIGDTGWRNVPIVSKLGNSFVKVRRVNSTVSYWFGGLEWGWFGIVRRNGSGYESHWQFPDKKVFLLRADGIPKGFRSNISLIGGIYDDNGKDLGTWYIGGYDDGNLLRFQFNEPVPTDKDIGDIRVSSISYLTDEPWPTVLP